MFHVRKVRLLCEIFRARFLEVAAELVVGLFSNAGLEFILHAEYRKQRAMRSRLIAVGFSYRYNTGTANLVLMLKAFRAKTQTLFYKNRTIKGQEGP